MMISAARVLSTFGVGALLICRSVAGAFGGIGAVARADAVRVSKSMITSIDAHQDGPSPIEGNSLVMDSACRKISSSGLGQCPDLPGPGRDRILFRGGAPAGPYPCDDCAPDRAARALAWGTRGGRTHSLGLRRIGPG